MNIVVLAGGLSPERDVSLSSGCMIANALMENGHRVLLADLYMGLPSVNNFEDAYKQYKSDRYAYSVPEREPDLDKIRASRAGGGAQLIGDGILEVCADADITFNALHGSIGENGQLQAVFDVYGIKYTGTGYEGSFMAMDKPLAKELMRGAGIATPDWFIYDTDDITGDSGGNGDSRRKKIGGGLGIDNKNSENAVGKPDIASRLGLPWVVKPCGCGSSVGVSMINSPDEFESAVAKARIYEKKVLVERKITGREFSVGILGGVALPPIEIMPKTGFYDYKNKYQKGAAIEICPPRDLSPQADAAMREVALRVHNLLRLGDYSRTDIIMDADENIYCLEINSLPGMTPTSLIPQEAAAAGIPYAEFCERVVTLAMKQHQLTDKIYGRINANDE